MRAMSAVRVASAKLPFPNLAASVNDHLTQVSFKTKERHRWAIQSSGKEAEGLVMEKVMATITATD